MDVFLIKSGVVENVICAESEEYASTLYPEYICIERPEFLPFGPGDLYDGLTFTKAPIPAVVPPPLSKLDFLRKFTVAQRIAIRTSSDPIVQDAIHMLDLAEQIELSDPDTINLVNYLAYINLIDNTTAANILEGL